MIYRWMTSEDDGLSWPLQLTPAGVSDPLFEWKRERSSFRAGARMSLGGNLVFSAKDDWAYLKARRDTQGWCATVPIRVELKCGSTWVPVWTGSFPAGGGQWNYSKCTITVQPIPDDRYSCLEAKKDVKANILLEPYQTVNARTMPWIDFGASYVLAGEIGSPSTVVTYNVSLVDGVPDQPGWAAHGLEWEFVLPATTLTYKLWWVEYFVTDCVGGLPQIPNGTGWTLIFDGCDNTTGPYQGQAVWARTPQFSFPLTTSDLVVGTNSGGVDYPPSASECPNGTWIMAWPGDWADFGPGPLPRYICFEGIQQNYTRSRTLASAFSRILSVMDCGIAGIRSDFFGINPVGDAPGYVAGLNYVTGEPTQTEGIVILQNTDVITPNATSFAVVGEMTFKELMQALGTMFRVLWDIDSEGYLRIEHYIYWNTQVGIDLTTLPPGSVVERLSHESLGAEVPSVEKLTFDVALTPDFLGLDIIYSGPCVSGVTRDRTISYSPGVVTDVAMIITDPQAIPRKGFTFIACMNGAPGAPAIVDTGAITGAMVSNAPLSAANLQRDYWTWDRYLRSGNMNGGDVEFDGSLPTIEQAESLVMCYGCNVITFDPGRLVRSFLGQNHLGGLNGFIEKATLDRNGHLRLNLRYAK